MPIPEFLIGPAARHGAVTVFPISAPIGFPTAAGAPVAYRLAGPAIAAGELEIAESPERATVGVLEARNRSRARVLIVEGDHVIGAKQNRMLTSSVLIGARRKVEVPASCVEQGRWQGPTMTFAGIQTMAPASLRRIAKLSVTRAMLGTGHRMADQDRIWSTIADQQRKLHISSATRALAHTFAERASEIGDASARLPRADGAVGLAIAIAGELISIDVFANPETCAHYWERIVAGAVLEGLGARMDRPIAAPAQVEDVRAALANAREASWSRVAPVGDGEEHRAQFAIGSTPGAAGSLLALDGRLVHLGVATPTALESPVRGPTRVRTFDLPSELADRYRIVGRIGAGGTKEVFRATVLAGGPDVAIARMPYIDGRLFEREIAVVRRVESGYVPKIHESLVDDQGDGYLVMEICDGPNLAALITAGPLSVPDAAPILVAFARGLREIHEAHVLHRDVKLENVMLAATPGGGVRLKILDFGLSARAASSTTAVGVVKVGGTLPYMPREVLRGRAIDARADVYAFGICVFRLLTGDFPAPPTDDESEFEYMSRLAYLPQHDLSRLAPLGLPAPVAAMLPRMLEAESARRPLMPEVCDAFERGFGERPLRVPGAVVARTRRPALPLSHHLAIATQVSAPEHVAIAPCMQAPIVALAPGDHHTQVTAYRADGAERWSRRIDGRFTALLRVDLDGDGIREIYLAGPGRFAVLGASGRFRFAREIPTYAAQPTLIALADREKPRIIVDGRLIDPATGSDQGTLGHTYQGNGSELIDAADARGISYNGFAHQAFRGMHGTGAGIAFRDNDPGFVVAHLEEARTGTPRVQLAVYGPGGGCRHLFPIAEAAIATGDRDEISRLYHHDSQLIPVRRALFGAASSPLVVLGPDRSVVAIAALLDPDRSIAPMLAAFDLATGRALWSAPLPRVGGRVILADVDGDRRPEVVVGDGTQLVAYDALTGGASEPIACAGLPIAFGDPFASGVGHLFTVAGDGIALWRGRDVMPAVMQWTGARGDLWRTGALREDGTPLGPT